MMEVGLLLCIGYWWIGWWMVMVCSNRLGVVGLNELVSLIFGFDLFCTFFLYFAVVLLLPICLFYFWRFRSCLASFICLISLTKHLQLTTHSLIFHPPSPSHSLLLLLLLLPYWSNPPNPSHHPHHNHLSLHLSTHYNPDEESKRLELQVSAKMVKWVMISLEG